MGMRLPMVSLVSQVVLWHIEGTATTITTKIIMAILTIRNTYRVIDTIVVTIVHATGIIVRETIVIIVATIGTTDITKEFGNVKRSKMAG